MRTLLRFAPIATLLLPAVAAASTSTDLIQQISGLFYVVVGLTVTMACLLMLGGVALWFSRLGTFPTYRDEAIKYMEWSVATLFTLIVLLGIVEFAQTHTQVILYIISTAIILVLGWLLATSDLFSGSAKKDEEHE